MNLALQKLKKERNRLCFLSNQLRMQILSKVNQQKTVIRNMQRVTERINQLESVKIEKNVQRKRYKIATIDD